MATAGDRRGLGVQRRAKHLRRAARCGVDNRLDVILHHRRRFHLVLRVFAPAKGQRARKMRGPQACAGANPTKRTATVSARGARESRCLLTLARQASNAESRFWSVTHLPAPASHITGRWYLAEVDEDLRKDRVAAMSAGERCQACISCSLRAAGQPWRRADGGTHPQTARDMMCAACRSWRARRSSNMARCGCSRGSVCSIKSKLRWAPKKPKKAHRVCFISVVKRQKLTFRTAGNHAGKITGFF